MKNEIKDMKNIIIIDCGPSLEDVSREFGQSPEWIMESLRYADCIFKWIKPYEGQTIKENTGDAWIITGSPRSVYDEDYWMLDLEENIRQASKNNKLILGICFGHQLLAKSFGGKVELNPKGWELGAYPICLTEAGIYSPLFKNIENQTIVYESHKDCVTYLPENAVQLAYNEKCIQSFQLNRTLFAVQFHPEFSWDVLKKYVSLHKSSGITVDDLHLPESTQSHLVLNNFINLI